MLTVCIARIQKTCIDRKLRFRALNIQAYISHSGKKANAISLKENLCRLPCVPRTNKAFPLALCCRAAVHLARKTSIDIIKTRYGMFLKLSGENLKREWEIKIKEPVGENIFLTVRRSANINYETAPLKPKRIMNTCLFRSDVIPPPLTSLARPSRRIATLRGLFLVGPPWRWGSIEKLWDVTSKLSRCLKLKPKTKKHKSKPRNKPKLKKQT